MFRCPYCEAEIETLDIQRDATVYETLDLATEDYNHVDEESGDIVSSECPECGHELWFEDVIDTDVVEDDEYQSETLGGDPIRTNLARVKTCEGCSAVVEFDKDEEELECPVCNKIIKL